MLCWTLITEGLQVLAKQITTYQYFIHQNCQIYRLVSTMKYEMHDDILDVSQKYIFSINSEELKKGRNSIQHANTISYKREIKCPQDDCTAFNQQQLSTV